MRGEVSALKRPDAREDSNEQSTAVVVRIDACVVENLIKFAIRGTFYSKLLRMSFSNGESALNTNFPMLFFGDFIRIVNSLSEVTILAKDDRQVEGFQSSVLYQV